MADEARFSDTPDDEDPLIRWLSQFGIPFGGGTPDLDLIMSQIQQAMAAPAGQASSVWDQARIEARRRVTHFGPDPVIDPATQTMAYDAYRLTNSWLDQQMAFEMIEAQPGTWTRSEWIDRTMATWRRLGEPIATRIGSAYAASFGDHLNDAGQASEQMTRFAAMLMPLLEQSASAMYAQQLSVAIAQLASEVLTGSEIGFQVMDVPRVVVLPTSISGFAEGLGVEENDVRLYLMLRESARQRLFAGVGWLAPHLLALVEHYAREITIDARALATTLDVDELDSLTPQKVQDMAETLQGKLFSPSTSAEQREILARLETSLALIEGWVDQIVHQTAHTWMPHAADLLEEAIRRRRATNDPARSFFKTLVGLNLSPRRVRDAMNLWSGLGKVRGVAGRDRLWAHPDLMPSGVDLDDPMRLIAPQGPAEATDDMDLALEELLTRAEEERRQDE